MAVLSRITCEDCNLTTEVMHSPSDPAPKKCGACQNKVKDDARTSHFAELDALSVEERLRRVEEWIYDYRPRVPLYEMRF